MAIKTVEDITPKTGYEMVKKFGISTLTRDDIVESLPLGVGAVSNLELAAAFEVIPNGGNIGNRYCIRRYWIRMEMFFWTRLRRHTL